MKVLVQWSLKNPQDWEQIDSADWVNLPKKEKPKNNELGGIDNSKGWIANVMVQGITTEGYDHVAIEEITVGLDSGVKLFTWNDDPIDWPIGERNAIVWTILPLAPDPKIGMAINTRQSCIRYCEGERYQRLLAHPPQNTTIRPWSEFVAPSENKIRHGVWLDQAKWEEHKKAAPQSKYGWMHWNEHLPDSECVIDKNGNRVLKEQRRYGRYHQAEHTITYYQRDTDRANGIFVYTNEDALETATAVSATETVTTNASSNLAWAFTTAANQPNSSDWPSGVYHAQINCTAASTGLVYGGDSFNRFDSALTSSLDTISISPGNGQSGEFSGTGLKLVTSDTYNPAAGSAGDRFGFLLSALGDSHGDAITIQLNTTDSYVDGPWTGGSSASSSVSLSPSLSPSASVSLSPSASQSPSSSISPSPSVSVSLSISPSPSSSVSLSPSLSPSVSVSLSISRSPSLSPSPSLDIPRQSIYMVNQSNNRSNTY